ncbi:FAD-dependent oxidoreductase [Halopseudomonas bauzanensis]|uniref:FAD-dependent oxidoreductase n=1 Tax=Halopseudomonas bauzanensis TaxID=653930 RepID=UPI00145C7D95|nr:FAD-dependent oxidoreductase [Halopseudomonas bauzanensis]
MSRSNDYDVIVVGGGGGGLAAALEARRAGASVVILEADKHLGGATASSGGVFYACGTSIQREAGIDNDRPRDVYDYLMTLNQWDARPDLIRFYAERCGPTLEWLRDMGAIFSPRWLVRSGVDTVPRGHSCEGAGQGIADALINAVGAAGIEVVLDCRVQSLIQEDGRVVGVRAQGTDLYASSVVVATGGFGNSPEMIRKHYPSAWHEGWTWAVHRNNPFILGDGITLGEAVGASIVGHDTGLTLPTSGFWQALEPWLPPWIMVVNKRGERFMSELSPYTVCGYLIEKQPERRAWAIFDDRALVEASMDIRYLDPYNAGINIPTWEEPTIRDQVAKGRVKASDSLEGLAALVGIDGETLARSVEVYNEGSDRGEDNHFHKNAPKLFPIRSGPFYAVEIRSAIIGNTAAGLDIDIGTRVLDQHKRPIPGLFAAGEVLGCFQGARYGGGGLAVGNAIVFGREAGVQGAAHALQGVKT